jgi:hypothetical protein
MLGKTRARDDGGGGAFLRRGSRAQISAHTLTRRVHGPTSALQRCCHHWPTPAVQQDHGGDNTVAAQALRGYLTVAVHTPPWDMACMAVS